MSKMTSRDHIPAPGLSAGLQGMALCGRWARYQTGDHALIRRLAAGVAVAHYCRLCLQRLRTTTPGEPGEE